MIILCNFTALYPYSPWTDKFWLESFKLSTSDYSLRSIFKQLPMCDFRGLGVSCLAEGYPALRLCMVGNWQLSPYFDRNLAEAFFAVLFLSRFFHLLCVSSFSIFLLKASADERVLMIHGQLWAIILWHSNPKHADHVIEQKIAWKTIRLSDLH